MRQFRVRVPNIGAGGGRAVPDMEKILKYPLLFEPEGVFSMSRKGMLSMEEAARAAVTGQVARRRMPGVLPTAAKRLYNEARLAGYEGGYGRVRDEAPSARESSKIGQRQHQPHQFGLPRDGQLPVDPLQVPIDGVLRVPHGSRHFVHGPSFGQPGRHPALHRGAVA